MATATATEPRLDGYEFVRGALARYLKVDPGAIEASHDLEHDWGMGRLDLVLMALRLEDLEHIDVPFEQLATVATVAELGELFARWLTSASRPIRALAFAAANPTRARLAGG